MKKKQQNKLRQKVDFDDYARSYTKLLEKNQTGLFTDDVAFFSQSKIEKISTVIGTNFQSILDYGCGIGKNIEFLQKMSPEAQITGYDISPESLRMAKKQFPRARFTDNAGKLGRYDLIFLSGVIHHISPAERDVILAPLQKKLTEKGCIAIFEHNPYNPVTRHMVSTCEFDHDAILISSRALKQLMARNGFACLERGYTLFIPARFTGLHFLEQYLRWLPLGGQHYYIGGPGKS